MVTLPQEPLHSLDRALNPHPRGEASAVFPVGAAPILHTLAISVRPCPVPWVLAPSHGCWPYPLGADPVPWALALSHGYWPCPLGTDPVPWVLALSHGCCPFPWELPCPKATGALTKALAAECLESLKKVRIPPSSTVQEELQFFLGRGAGVTQG